MLVQCKLGQRGELLAPGKVRDEAYTSQHNILHEFGGLGNSQ